MRQKAIEHATAEFYAWEKHGRGTALACLPIQLEPELKPFFFHTSPHRAVDDGHRPTVLSSIVALFKSSSTISARRELDAFNIECFPDEGSLDVAVLRLTFPAEFRSAATTVEQCVLLLTAYAAWLSFEIVATDEKICFQFACDAAVAPLMQQQLKVHFPNVQVEVLGEEGLVVDNRYTAIVDFGLAQEFMRPIATHLKDSDPLRGIFGVLEHLAAGERAVVQVLFSKTINDWSESILRSVTDSQGEPFFLDAPEMLPLAKEKVQHPLFACTIRVLTQAADAGRAHDILTQLAILLAHQSAHSSNSITALPAGSYTIEQRIDDIILRQSHRAGMLLNSRELATFVRFPTDAVQSQKLQRIVKRTKAAPPSVRGSGVLVGINEHQGKISEVHLDDESRYKHVHILGSTGTGKSTLLMQLALQDIEAGKGVMVLDPHGDLIDAILYTVPSSRKDDVIVIDPSNTDFPIGLNMLAIDSNTQQDVLAADIVAVFRRLSTSWGDQMNSVLSNAILAFLENTKQGTLIDLRRFLIEKPFRDAWLRTTTDPAIVYYWQHEYQLLKSSSLGPILTRLDSFLRPKQIRYMMSQQKMVNFADVLEKGKVVLVKLSQGLIGAENAYLLGTLLVSKLHQVALAQQSKDAVARSNFFMYIDEFQHFATPSMATMLSGVRKYKLSLTLAHQDLQQLQRYDAELASSILTNTYTRICFRLGDADAKRMQEGFTAFTAPDFLNLETGAAIARIGRSTDDFNVTTVSLPAASDENSSEYIITHSDEVYGTSKEVVEAYISENLKSTVEPRFEKSAVDTKGKPAATENVQTTEPINLTTESVEPIGHVDDTIIARRVAQHEQSLHRRMQLLVKKLAEECGWTATIEAALQDSTGKVDVSLEKAGQRIACEISVTTGAAWEAHNVEKCLQNKYDLVICLAPDATLLQQLKKKLTAVLPPDIQAKVQFSDPATLNTILTPSAPQPTETVMKGRRISVEYKDMSAEEAVRRQSIIRKIVSNRGGKKKGE